MKVSDQTNQSFYYRTIPPLYVSPQHKGRILSQIAEIEIAVTF